MPMPRRRIPILIVAGFSSRLPRYILWQVGRIGLLYNILTLHDRRLRRL